MVWCTFNPTEEELIITFLNSKIMGKDELVESLITEIEIYQHEPPDLPGLAKIPSDRNWYFFSRLEKFGKFDRTKRRTENGNWKITGPSSLIKNINGIKVGFKKILSFQKKTPSCSSTTTRRKSEWVIHEYHSFLLHPNREAYVLCKLIKKSMGGRNTVTEASSLGTERSFSVSSDSVLTQTQELTSSSVIHDNSGGFVYKFDELPPKFLGSADQFAGDIGLQQPELHYLQSQSFKNTINPWDGCISSNQLSNPFSVSEINYHQILETSKLNGGSDYKNMSEFCHVHGQNTVEIEKSWEQGESSFRVASDKVSVINNYHTQDTAEFYYENVSIGSYPWEQGESSSVMPSDTVFEANNYQIQETGDITGNSSCYKIISQFCNEYGQDNVDLSESGKVGDCSNYLGATDAVTEANNSSLVEDFWWWQLFQENQRSDDSIQTSRGHDPTTFGPFNAYVPRS